MKLTPRETSVVRLLMTGASNKAIGYELGLTENTIKAYLSRIMATFYVGNRMQLVLLAQSEGVKPWGYVAPPAVYE